MLGWLFLFLWKLSCIFVENGKFMSKKVMQISDTSVSRPSRITPRAPRKISWETFQKKYLTREDGYKYEWLNGVVEKTKSTMDKTQFYILRNLLRFFRKLLNEGKVSGELIPEGDLFFEENHRRLDVCWLTDEQIE